MQQNEDVKHQDAEMYCATNQFTELSCCGPHNKPHVVHTLGKHYHMRFDTRLEHEIREINHIPCVFNQCKYMIELTWTPSVKEHQQPHSQHAKYFTYWPVLGYFNNWDIIQLSHRETWFEEIDRINQVVLDSISYNMDVLLHTGEYDVTNTTDTTTMGYSVI